MLCELTVFMAVPELARSKRGQAVRLTEDILMSSDCSPHEWFLYICFEDQGRGYSIGVVATSRP